MLRPATMKDVDLLYEWRNDPVVRRASHQQSEIELSSHHVWLRESLENSGRKIFVAEKNGVPVGTVRSDFSDGVHELSWTIAPGARGQGLGARMVALLAGLIQGPIRAEIGVGNVASVRIAEKVGMVLVCTKDGIMHFRKD